MDLKGESQQTVGNDLASASVSVANPVIESDVEMAKKSTIRDPQVINNDITM